MGASPAHDDPFTSDVKVNFNGDHEEGSDAERRPKAQSQQHTAAGAPFMEDRAFERPAQVRPPRHKAPQQLCITVSQSRPQMTQWAADISGLPYCNHTGEMHPGGLCLPSLVRAHMSVHRRDQPPWTLTRQVTGGCLQRLIT